VLALTVVIPSRDRPDLLVRCLASVVRHAPAGTEILVVDDASSGSSVLRAAAAFAGVRVVRRPVSGGFCAAANDGIQAARGEVVELLNDDAEVTAGWAEAALAPFVRREVAAVAPLVLCGPPEMASTPPLVDSAGDRYLIGGIARKRGHREPLAAHHLRGGPVFGACAAAAFYRTCALRGVGALPSFFGAYFEDVDLAFRLHRAGFRVLYEPASRVWHQVSASYGKPAGRSLERQSRNEELVFWRNLPRGVLLRALPWHLAVLVGKAWKRWREGRLVPFLRGRVAALSEVDSVLRHRRWLHRFGPVRNLSDWCLEEVSGR
jgi:GT2 family glycosyltransferase